jgi:hypothetical protein
MRFCRDAAGRVSRRASRVPLIGNRGRGKPRLYRMIAGRRPDWDFLGNGAGLEAY